MSWNYRVMRHQYKDKTFTFGIHEVFYDSKNKIKGWTKDEISPCAETIKELKSDMAMINKSLTAPVLDWKTGKSIAVNIRSRTSDRHQPIL